MKRHLFLLICSLFVCVICFAQTNYYTESKVFDEEGYAYQCDIKFGDVVLYNKANKWTGIEQKHKATGEIFKPENTVTTYESWLEYRKKFPRIMKTALSDIDEDLQRNIRGQLFLDLFINTETGRVDDIVFYFFRKSGLVYIPISVFRQLELSIKETCRFTITEEGKRVNYAYLWDSFKF